MGFCPQCGTKFESGDQFCENCGYNLARPTPPAGQPAEDDADKTVIMPPRTPTHAARASTAGASSPVPSERVAGEAPNVFTTSMPSGPARR